MSKHDKYIAGQKASGIEKGDTVRVVRTAITCEDGWGNSWEKSMKVGDSGVVSHLGESGVYFGGHQGKGYPYFVLQIVKKKDGSVPSNETLITGELSMSTTNFECKAVLVETAGDGTEKKTVFAFKNDLFEVDETEAKRRFSMFCAADIQEKEKKGKVQILCSPFCSG